MQDGECDNIENSNDPILRTYVSIPPKESVAKAIGRIKRKSALIIFGKKENSNQDVKKGKFTIEEVAEYSELSVDEVKQLTEKSVNAYMGMYQSLVLTQDVVVYRKFYA